MISRLPNWKGKKKINTENKPWMLGEHVLLLTKLCFHQDTQQILKENMNSLPVWLEPTAQFEASDAE